MNKMNKMNEMKIYNEQGMLNAYGKDTFEEFLKKEINILLNSAENEAEAKLLGSIIANYIDNMVLEKCLSFNKS